MKLENFLHILSTSEVLGKASSTLAIILTLYLIRYMSYKSISKLNQSNDVKLEWKSYTRMLINILVFVGLLLIWGSELKTFAISIVAIAAAIVIATKELILCFVGGIYKSISRPFKIGDRIGVHTYNGDVIHHDFLTTTIFEIGPQRSSQIYTGRRVIFPNSLLLQHPVINETKRFKYGLHTFTVSKPATVNIKKHKEALLTSANKVCSEFQKEASNHIKNIGRTDGIETPSAEPKVIVSFASGTSVDFIVRIPIPALKSARIEQEVLDHYIDSISDTEL